VPTQFEVFMKKVSERWRLHQTNAV